MTIKIDKHILLNQLKRYKDENSIRNVYFHTDNYEEDYYSPYKNKHTEFIILNEVKYNISYRRYEWGIDYIEAMIGKTDPNKITIISILNAYVTDVKSIAYSTKFEYKVSCAFITIGDGI